MTCLAIEPKRAFLRPFTPKPWLPLLKCKGRQNTRFQLTAHYLWGLPKDGLKGTCSRAQFRVGRKLEKAAKPTSYDSATSTQLAQWHLHSPAPNSSLMRLLEAESALARQFEQHHRGSLPVSPGPPPRQERGSHRQQTLRGCSCLTGGGRP